MYCCKCSYQQSAGEFREVLKSYTYVYNHPPAPSPPPLPSTVSVHIFQCEDGEQVDRMASQIPRVWGIKSIKKIERFSGLKTHFFLCLVLGSQREEMGKKISRKGFLLITVHIDGVQCK